MLKKMGEMMDRWGYYLLAAVCVGVIVLSAIWTKAQEAEPRPHAAALSDESQRLGDVTPAPSFWQRPCEGRILRGMSGDMTHFPDTGMWMIHAGVDFAAQPGDAVYAMAPGRVTSLAGGVTIAQDEGSTVLYRGMQTLTVHLDQRVSAGEKLGTAGGRVPFEGAHLCVTVFKNGKPWDFSEIIH